MSVLAGGCAVGRGIAICMPRCATFRRYRRCPFCKLRVRSVYYDEGYYGVRSLLACGHSWADGEWWPRYQGPVHRRSVAAEVSEVWRAKLPPWAEQQRWLDYYMGHGERPEVDA